MADLTTATSLLTLLESSPDLTSLHTLFKSHLKPFPPKTDTETRTLAKQYLSFLSKSLTLLPKRLNKTPKLNPNHAHELFKTYKLCLSCLEAINSELFGKRYSVQVQRARLIHCYEYWGKYNEAKAQGLYVLRFIGELYSGTGKGKWKGGVPELGKDNKDKDLAMLIVEVVVTIVKCVANARCEDEADVVDMVFDIEPWLRIIDADAYEKLHKMLVTYLIRFGKRICSSLFSPPDDQIVCSIDLLTRVLDVMAHQCMLRKETSLVNFLEFVDYCANKCRNATVDFCGAVATHFKKLANDYSQVKLSSVNLILRLYAISLSLSDLNYYSREGSPKMAISGKDISIPKLLLDMENRLQRLTTVHGYLLSKVDNGMSMAADTRTYMSSYFTALNFLCEPLTKLMISEREDILCGFDDNSYPIKLPNIEDAFHQFILVSSASDNDGDVYNNYTVLSVAIAAFTLSFATKKKTEACTKFLKDLILTDCLQTKGLKYLYASLHNVGIVLYKSDRLTEATKSLELCCQAAWSCVIHLCKMFASSTDESSSDLSEDAITVFATEACAKSAFLLDTLHQCGSKKISRTLIDCLERWSVAHSLFEKMPIPVALVKQWVKIECKEIKDPEARHSATTIYFLMSSSVKMSKETLSILSEQELQAYMEFKSLNPELCKIMQPKISNLLLKETCNTKDSFLQKSRILIANARESRARGIEGLNDSIKYLSEVISIMSDLYNKDEHARDLLAQAYCLRTLCTQEAEPNSKLFVQDIGNALKLWLSQEQPQSAEQTRIVSLNTFTLLYHVGDLLSLKGYMEDHSDIYEMMFRFFTSKNVSLKECITILWQSRSFRHCLCTSPVSDAFIMTLSKHCELFKSMEFWISCMERSKSLGVGFRQSLSVISTLSSPDSYSHEHAPQPLASVDDVKQAASDLISNVPLSSKSLFLAAHLYYDLCERVIAKGSMIEALSYAKEAHRLRVKLFQKRFIYSTEQHNDIFGDNGELIKKRGYGLKSFYMHPSVATSAWLSHDMDSSDLVDFILTPWNVLQCYLESILQVGTIQEIIGNGSEAEALLAWGKNISVFHGLPIFIVSFSSALGQLYHKRRLWHLAEKELESAKHTLADSCSLISCFKCKLVLQVTVDKQLGDLYRSRFNNATGNKLYEELSKAETLYRSAVDKLKLTEWNNCVSHPKKTTAKQEEIQPGVTKKGKKTAKPLPQEQRVTSRVTRSSKQRRETAQNESQKVMERKTVSFCNDALVKKGTQMSKVGCITSCGCEVTCVCDDKDCWHCLSYGVMKSLSVKSIIQMKWEITRRRLLLRLLTRIGKCLTDIEETQRAHNVFLESISVLVSRIEHASLLYSICWFSLRSSWNKGTRNDCCDLSFIPMPTVLSGLKLSFILCREVPELFQKVSRLLSVLYTLSPSNKEFSTLFASKALSESQWASYFHQASLGTHLNYQLFSHLGKPTDRNTVDVDGSSVTNSTPLSLHRLAPESVMDLEEFIIKFFLDLPRATIVCISVLGDTYACFLRDLLPYEYSAHAWIMFSRLNSDNAPIVIALPLGSILAGSLEDDEDSSSCIFSSCGKSWHCPWDHTIIDEVAPLFRRILEQNYASTSGHTLEDTKQNRSLWWNQRKKLDQCLGDLLSDMEDLWFGPWKYLLLGGLINCKHLDSVTKKLMKDLKSKCKVNISENILRSLISGASSQQIECLSELILKKGCYIGGIQCDNDRSPGENSSCLYSLVSDFLTNAIHEIGDDLVGREPVILVPDFDIQMLPWESMPLLKNQEVYRMPSIASISCTYDRCCHIQEKVGKDFAVSPMIDPLDAYYLLNPGGDLSETEAEFGAWFKDQNLEGTSGTSPTVDELSAALKNHDLFIYVGHGSGVQYIPGGEIQKLDGCAATFLMGCSSGSLSLNGSYTPKDKDIDRFGKAMLDAWIAARSTSSLDCAQCTEIADKLKELNIDEGKRKGKKISQCKSAEVSEINYSTFGCKHRPKVGSFMGNARQACALPFLIGAAPVCYGVPTGIRKKNM
uniref:separase n=1 Tax=Tanacetum cinerariifolium TaxID=118510 RepID=A0A6L2NPI5_TANCI|nr:separase isoform X1 [Tanacetum cinerariifolium]